MNVLVSQVVPQNMVVRTSSSQAANNFCFNLMNGKCFDLMVSIVPPNVTSEVGQVVDGVRYFQFLIFRKLKIFNIFNLLLSNVRAFLFLRQFPFIWFYNISPSNFLSFCLCKLWYKCKVFVIVADYTPSKSLFSLQWFLGKLFAFANGGISLSGRANVLLKNCCVKSGIILKSNLIYKEEVSLIPDGTYLLAGRLEDSTGLDLAISCFRELNSQKLLISGSLSDEVKSELLNYPNIQYLGILEYTEYIDVLKGVSFILSLRNPAYAKNDNNFPSKIIEAFVYKKVVISTFDYPELADFKYLKCDFDKDSFSRLITELSLHESKYEFNGFDNHDKLIADFSEDSWKIAIYSIQNNA